MLDLLSARCCVQHQLLSFESFLSNDDPRERYLTETCRLSTLVFSEMVTWPFPEAQRIKPMLARKLKDVLQNLVIDPFGLAQRRLLVWTTTLGSIASMFTEYHDWFVGQMYKHLLVVRIHTWDALESLCSSFLWWGPVCEPPGRVVWKEVQHMPQEPTLSPGSRLLD